MGQAPARLTAFKAYDIRGRIPDELTADRVRDIGRAYAGFLSPKRVVVGHDIRLSSPEFASALTDGLNSAGVDVVDIGLCGTEEVYFAVFHLGLDGGVMVTASHNPADYNGLKLVRDLPWPVADLRVDWTDDDPIEALARLWALYKPQLEDYVTRALDPTRAPSYGVPGDA